MGDEETIPKETRANKKPILGDSRKQLVSSELSSATFYGPYPHRQIGLLGNSLLWKKFTALDQTKPGRIGNSYDVWISHHPHFHQQVRGQTSLVVSLTTGVRIS